VVRIAGSILVLSLIAGCSSNINALPSYIGVPGTRVSTDHDDFTVHDRAHDGRMMVVASMESSMGEDFIDGREIDTTDAGTPHAYFAQAAHIYLNQTGRAGCEIVSATKVINSQYEIVYDCG